MTTHPCWSGTIHWQIPHAHTCFELNGKIGTQNNSNVVFFLAETTAAEKGAHISIQYSQADTIIVRSESATRVRNFILKHAQGTPLGQREMEVGVRAATYRCGT